LIAFWARPVTASKIAGAFGTGENGVRGEGGGYQDGIDRHCERSEAIQTAAPRWIASSLRSSQ
jgi:hypothetical protein